MLRILSGLVLIVVFFCGIWYLPPWLLLVVAEGVLLLAFIEYARLAESLGARVPRAASSARKTTNSSAIWRPSRASSTSRSP